MNVIGTSARAAATAAARTVSSGASSGVWARRLAKTPLRRNPRHLSTSAVLFKKQVGPPVLDPYAPSALNSVLARLSLPPTPEMREALMSCLTHPSFNRKSDVEPAQEAEAKEGEAVEPAPEASTNELLSALGNSLLGLFASESLSAKYPHIPSAALAQAVTYYVGPMSLVALGRELGISTQGNYEERAAARANPVLAMPIRWKRNEEMKLFDEEDSSSQFSAVQARRAEQRQRRKDSWEEGVASVVRAFVGLIYQEKGLHAARQFVEQNVMTRHVDLTGIFKFRNPKYMLSHAVTKHLVDAGVPITPESGRIDSRLLASTGVNTQAPLFNVGLFLSNGIKLAEGHGSSMKMAEHRAATNGLLSLWLLRSDIGGQKLSLPTSIHPDRPITKEALNASPAESEFKGSSNGGSEPVQGLSGRTAH